jgi:5-methylcytosine-specific restriction endonuclease McrA
MRREFSKTVKWDAYKRCLVNDKPHCESCGLRIIGVPEFDHVKPDGLGGEPTLENCAVLCGKCHRLKTHEEDRPIMAKADRQKKAAAGVKRKWNWPKRKLSPT